MKLTAKGLETKDWAYKWLTCIAVLLVALSCGFKPKQPNVLVVSIENFSSGSVNCLDDNLNSESKAIICEEFVRFSHAYTSSALSQPALASILSGLYPFQNNVWNNGSSYLSEKYWTVAELANERGYSTSFFSGGGSIWRKSGFSQGFEVFDEHDYRNLDSVYRSASELNDRFLNWLTQTKQTNFFSFLYYTDLQFPSIGTVDSLGVERALSKNSQLLEVSESLGDLFKTLKSKNLWDNSLVVITGLNGLTPIDRNTEFSPMNLHSENTQIALFIKPPRKKRDRGLNWTIDTNVNLVDLGVSLFDFLGQKVNSKSILSGRSLVPFLKNENAVVETDHPLLIESGWSQWKTLGNTRSALFLGKKLFFYQDPIVVYNTLIDQKESIPISWQDLSSQPEKTFVLDLFQRAGLDVWAGLNYFEVRKFKLGELLWREGLDKYLYDELRLLANKTAEPIKVLKWLVYHSVVQQKWSQLQALSKSYPMGDWEYLAYKRLNKNINKSKYKNMSPCFKFLLNENLSREQLSRGESPEECESSRALALYNWKYGPRNKKDYWREKFIQDYRQLLERRQLAKLNYIAGLSWSVSTEEYLSLDATELFLALQENSFYQSILNRRLDFSPYGGFSKK